MRGKNCRCWGSLSRRWVQSVWNVSGPVLQTSRNQSFNLALKFDLLSALCRSKLSRKWFYLNRWNWGSCDGCCRRREEHHRQSPRRASRPSLGEVSGTAWDVRHLGRPHRKGHQRNFIRIKDSLCRLGTLFFSEVAIELWEQFLQKYFLHSETVVVFNFYIPLSFEAFHW